MEVSLDDLITEWENSVASFFLWLEVICGREKDSETYQILMNVIKEKCDIEDWIVFFDGDLDNIELTTLNFISAKNAA